MRILAVGCHPDDLEISCGGTLAKYAKLGHTVFMVHVANGNLGHAVIMPDELRAIRRKEAQEAGRVLGVEEVLTPDIGDLFVSSFNEELARSMTEIVRYTKPDAIITHSDTDYMRDHVETGKTVFNASFSSSVPHYETKSPMYGKIAPIYYMDNLAGVNFLPTTYVDISDTIEQKLEALACHESQIKWMLEHDKIDFLDFVRTCSRFRGLQSGVTYAEGFNSCQTWPRVPCGNLLP